MASRMSEENKARGRRTFTREYMAHVVAQCGHEGKTRYSGARELGLAPTAVRAWVKQAKVDVGGGATGPLTRAEREELSRLTS
jgi:transposase